MSRHRRHHKLPPLLVAAFLLVLGTLPAFAQPGNVFVQCPGDVDGDAVPDEFCPAGFPSCGAAGAMNPEFDEDVVCMHLTGGDGFVRMADDIEKELYFFGFKDVTGVGDTNGNGTIGDEVMAEALLGAEFSAPTIELNEGEKFYLNLTNVTMNIRPDLADPHTVHYHGFPNAAPIFDGLPDSSLSVKMGTSLTYYYKNVVPGTYIYHCHVEATEHMQMGMLGNLFVRAKQGVDGCETGPCGPIALPGGYAYNDDDGSTAYDVEYPIQIGSFDPIFHDASQAVQPLPFAGMKDRYPMLNGRGYMLRPTSRPRSKSVRGRRMLRR